MFSWDVLTFSTWSTWILIWKQKHIMNVWHIKALRSLIETNGPMIKKYWFLSPHNSNSVGNERLYKSQTWIFIFLREWPSHKKYLIILCIFTFIYFILLLPIPFIPVLARPHRSSKAASEILRSLFQEEISRWQTRYVALINKLFAVSVQHSNKK